MENFNEINEKIAKNLAYYRKASGLTQVELAQKINYSDKSVSKWESGNGVPDVYILMELAKLYGVTLNDLVGDETPSITERKNTAGLHILITLLSMGMVWLLATCVFVGGHLFRPTYPWWITFLYATELTFVVIVVYASIWHYRFLNFIGVTGVIWLGLVCLYATAREVSILLQNNFDGLWCLFLLGIPLQVLEVLWTFFRYLFVKRNLPKKAGEKAKNTEKAEKAENTENTEEKPLEE